MILLLELINYIGILEHVNVKYIGKNITYDSIYHMSLA